MAGNTRELIKALCSVADEQNINVTVKKSPLVRGFEIATAFGDKEASEYLEFRAMNGIYIYNTSYIEMIIFLLILMIAGPPRPLSDVILNDLSQSQRIELIDQVIEAITEDIDVDSSEVVELILEDEEVKTLASSTLETFIEDRADLTIDRPAGPPCSIL